MITKYIELPNWQEEGSEPKLTEAVQEPAEIIRSGGLVAFPTETVYGLGANGLDAEAAKKIYEAKGRPSDNPLILHIAEMETLSGIVKEIPEMAVKLAEKFWPGPLTMIFPKADCVPDGTTGGLPTVAVRMPEHPVALALIRSAGVPIAAPSANTSGRPSPTEAEHVREDMDGRIDCILDGGAVGIGLESTIVDVTGEEPVILRPGYITKEMLEEVLGRVEVDPVIVADKPDPNLKPKAPGMKYRHYAPKADMLICEGAEDAVVSYINERTEAAHREGKRVGVLATDTTKERYQADLILSVGDRERDETIAHNLFQVLRSFDEAEVDEIYSESFVDARLSMAIMNRLLKAAGYHRIQV